MSRSLPTRVARVLLVALAAVASSAQAGELVVDFRGGKFDAELLKYDGPNPEQYTSLEPEGLRIRLPGGQGRLRPVGVWWAFPLRGDFVLTAAYEILQADTPKAGHGVGAELWLMLDNPARDGLAVGRLVRVGVGPVLTYTHMTNDAAGKRAHKSSQILPTGEHTRRGRLRLTREGATLIAATAEGDAGPFVELFREEVGPEDIRMARFAGMTGNDQEAGLDLRLTELRVQGPQVPDAANARAEAVGVAVPTAESRVWLLAGVGLALLLALGVALLLWLRRPRKSAEVTDERGADAPAEAGAPTAGTVGVACPSCGKGLRVKAEATGKRLKCPGCGQAVAVPTPGEDVPNSLERHSRRG